MCNMACVEFGRQWLKEVDICGKSVLEVGSRDVNGSLRAIAESMKPLSYVGVDIIEGPGVDEVCDAGMLVDRFGRESFDVVISTEMLEHVREWRRVVSNLKNLLRPDGILLITTRSRGLHFHGYPYDFWRYEIDDMNILFSDLLIERLEKDPINPGVFMKARRPKQFVECDLSNHILFSIVRSKKCDITDFDLWITKPYWATYSFLERWSAKYLPHAVKARISKMLPD
jgi:SAM-dependent methyltransferase